MKCKTMCFVVEATTADDLKQIDGEVQYCKDNKKDCQVNLKC